MNKVLLLLVPALALAGCSTPVPQALTPAERPARFTGPVAADAKVWPDAAWWAGFGDPALTALIGQAQADNRDIAAAAARVLQAQARTKIQRGALFPQLEAQAQHSAGQCGGQACGQYQSGRQFSLGFNASYELDFWGLARNNLRAADEQLKSARFARQSVAMTVTANVAARYLEILALRSRAAIKKQNIAAIDEIMDVITLRVKTGASSHLDLAREEAQLEAAQSQLPALQTQEAQALFTMAVLLGRPPEGLEVSGGTLEAIHIPTVAPGLPSDLLLRRPDVAQAEADLAAAHANLDAARAAFLPRITLDSAGGFAAGTLGTLLQGPNTGLGYGASLLQSIFDGGALAGQHDLARAVQSEAVARYQTAALNAYADVESALTEFANTARSEAHLRKLIVAARQAFAISQLQYRQGATDLLNVLQAQQTLFSAEDQLIQVMLANRLAAVHLFEALGGGWQEAPEDRTQVALENRLE